MPTVINNPQPAQNSDNGMGFFLGIVILLIAAVFFLMYGVPYLRGISGGGFQLNVPKDYNIHVDTNK